MQGKKLLIISIIVAVVLAGGAGFFGGLKYQRSKDAPDGFGAGDFKNMTTEQRQQMAQQFSAGSGTRIGNINRNGAGDFINGEIIVKDDKSITIKLRDGGSKIVFYSDKTEIGKFAEGGAGDLEVGKSVNASGQANQDGSVNAQSIQIRPATPETPAAPQQ